MRTEGYRWNDSLRVVWEPEDLAYARQQAQACDNESLRDGWHRVADMIEARIALEVAA